MIGIRWRSSATFLHDEAGMALVMAIGVMATIAIMGGSLVLFSTSNEGTANRSRSDHRAYSLAQTGIDSAVAQLANGSSSAIITSTFFNSLTKTTSFGTGESATWTPTLVTTAVGALTQYKWTISSSGTVPNPGGAGSISRTVTADVRLKPTTTQTINASAWRYVYSWKTGDPDGCDMELPNNPSVQSSFYVAGNFCLDNNSSVLGPTTGNPEVNVNVRGNIVLLKSGNDVGTAARPLTSLNVGGASGCKFRANPYHNPCTSADNTRPNSTLGSAIAQPVANFVDWYTVASPGPANPCEVTSGTPPTFDTDGTNGNGALTNVVQLDSMASFTCRTGLGELSWNLSTLTLTVNGTIFIDGSISLSSGSIVQYDGLGAIYLSGTFYMRQTQLCGLVSAGTCDNTNWNAAQDVLLIAAKGPQDFTACTQCSALLEQSAQFQGALYGEYNLGFQNNSEVQGPMVAKEELIQNSFTFNYIPTIVNVPFGTPGNTITTYSVISPTNYGG
ncbi:MAG: hypothetical protein LH654_10650 [Thermoleophilia bacterium]|nr:hypothetical protein [Thermoleophilia bacterium]